MGSDRPPPDDARIYDAYIAGRRSAALAAAVRVGLFDALAREERDAGALATELGLDRRATELVCRTLVAMGLLVRTGAGLALAGDARRHLVSGAPEWLGGLIDLEVENALTPALLVEALKSGRPSVYGGADPWARHARDPEAAAAFTRAMHSISALPGPGLAAAVPAGDVRRLLDVGGGSGALSIALARAWPELRCTIVDLPRVCALARDYVADARLGERIATHAGDFFTDPLPGGHDAALLAQILHDWPRERGAALVRRVADALPAGGQLWIHEKLVREDGTGPLANHLVDLDMLVWTEGQQYTEAELRALLDDAGFTDVFCRPTAGLWSVVGGRKAPS